MKTDFLVVGLGNPGEKYEHSKHNAGRIALEHVRERLGAAEWVQSKSANTLYSRTALDGREVELLAPQCFMNESGGPVKVVQQKHDLASENIIVLYDELDVPLGEFKISYDRGAGGHNGVTSIENKLGTKKFVRVRIGIAPVTLFGSMKHVSGERRKRYVLKDFTRGERKRLDVILDDVVRAVESIIVKGKKAAMNTYN